MLRIVTVFPRTPTKEDAEPRDLAPLSMAYIRWFRITEALAAQGHRVDMAVPDESAAWPANPQREATTHVRKVPLSAVRWYDYDVVKTAWDRRAETCAALFARHFPHRAA